MDLFATLAQETERRGLQFVVIGGLAVNFYGYSRETADLDVLVLRDSRAAWLSFFAQLGYSVEHEAQTFIQFAPPGTADWPVDLMLVGEPTFRQMFEASSVVEMRGAKLRIPSLDHLMALKLHALKHTRPHRFLKDFQDLEGLLMVNHLDPKSENIRLLFAKYGTLDLHEKIIRACSNE